MTDDNLATTGLQVRTGVYSPGVVMDDADMDKDWVDDESLSREETLARFRALGPEPTRGPALPAGAVIVTTPESYGAGVITIVGGTALRVTSSHGQVQEGAQPISA